MFPVYMVLFLSWPVLWLWDEQLTVGGWHLAGLGVVLAIFVVAPIHIAVGQWLEVRADRRGDPLTEAQVRGRLVGFEGVSQTAPEFAREWRQAVPASPRSSGSSSRSAGTAS
jgi:hypothetical protein